MVSTDISRERARHILADFGLEAEWCSQGDYYIDMPHQGSECLGLDDMDLPLAVNNGTMSWLGSGMPYPEDPPTWMRSVRTDGDSI